LFAFGSGETRAEIVRGETTVKVAELLVPTPGPLTTTGTAPSATPLGTVATMLVLLQVAVAGTPPNVIVLVPCVDPKLLPAIVTAVPIGPEVGVRPVIAAAVNGGLTSTRLRL
jgi:hypothetical protein